MLFSPCFIIVHLLPGDKLGEHGCEVGQLCGAELEDATACHQAGMAVDIV